ncbi:MAG: hypothetical protein O3B64_03555 [bacterium]|nr:hypothetical protein [bacterium]
MGVIDIADETPKMTTAVFAQMLREGLSYAGLDPTMLSTLRDWARRQVAELYGAGADVQYRTDRDIKEGLVLVWFTVCLNERTILELCSNGEVRDLREGACAA